MLEACLQAGGREDLELELPELAAAPRNAVPGPNVLDLYDDLRAVAPSAQRQSPT